MDVAARCDHCGLPVPAAFARPEESLQFCCGGCRSVYGLLHDLGFDQYYRLRDADGAPPVPARVTGRSYEDFDDDAFAAEHARPTDRGTCRTRLYLEGVHCAACVWLVERLPAFQPGVVSVRLNLPRAQAEVEWDPGAVRLSAVAQALDRLGYAPHPWRRKDIESLRKSEDRSLLIRVGVAVACAMNIMMLQGALYAGEYQGIEPVFVGFFRWLALALSLPVMLYSARPFYTAAWSGIRQRVPHVDLPIAIAILGAFAFSAAGVIAGDGPIYFDSVSMLVALLLGGRFLQSRAQRAAVERSEALRGIAFVEFAHLLVPEGGSREVPVESLKPGQRVEVLSGELVPADGVVQDGESAVDNSVLTGESMPIPIHPGVEVSAGATNRGARIVLEVRAAGEGTRVGALLRMVDEAASGKAPLVQAADRWSRWFVVGVLGLAAVTAAIWLPEGLESAITHVVALLVVSCPCALALGTPVAMTVGVSRAARIGIFLKGPDVIERLREVRTVLLDKTGTLTEGRLAVVEHDLDADTAARVVALEAQSSHPIALAMRAMNTGTGTGKMVPASVFPAGKTEAGTIFPVEDVQESLGRGIRGTVGGRSVAAGNLAHLESLAIAIPDAWRARADDAAARGLSPVLVAVDGTIRGLVALGDPLRPEARATIDALRRRGWRPMILSGDHPAVVARVADALGIPQADAHGGLTPEAKRDVVASLAGGRGSSQSGRVLMVGDGVNDAAALALADVGVSVHGGAGPSLAAADVVFTRQGLDPLLQLELGSRLTLRIIHRNLLLSLCYNFSGIFLAMSGLVGPLLAAVLMPLSSLTVILSSIAGRTFFRAPARGESRPWS
jgi:Cu2+-exporting ATPase